MSKMSRSCATNIGSRPLFLANQEGVDRQQDNVVGIATGYGLDDQKIGVRFAVGSRIFTPPSRPDRLWGPLNLLSNGYRGLFLRGKAAGA
jgi:hypothetical protein